MGTEEIGLRTLGNRKSVFWTDVQRLIRKPGFVICGFNLFYPIACLVLLYFSPVYNDGVANSSLAKWPEHGPSNVASHFVTWDAACYLKVSENGYSSGPKFPAFYPAWPSVLAGASLFTSIPLPWVSLFLAAIFSSAGMFLFFRYVSELHGEEIAWISLGVLNALPGSIFLHLPYSEPLFFFLLMSFITATRKKSSFTVIVSAFALPLSRSTGFFIVLPLLWICALSKPNRWSDTKAVVGLAAGICAYFWLMWWETGSPTSGFSAQRLWIHNIDLSGSLLMRPIEGLLAFSEVRGFHSFNGSLLDRFFFIITGFSLYSCWKSHRSAIPWIVALGILPALFNSFVSYTRFFPMCFPAVIWLARKIRPSTPNSSFCIFAWAFLCCLHVRLLLNYLCFQWAG